ncbi:type VII secretion-associated serine protease mycosin [soil metagenome]
MRRRTAPILLLGCLMALVIPSAASGDDLRDDQWYLADYGFETVWQTTEGEGVLVAVIDSGIDATHPDLAGAVRPGIDLTGESSDGTTAIGGAGRYHGTAVASLIAGRGHGDGGADGVRGVAPAAELLPVAMASSAAGDDIYEQLPEAIRYAVDHEADVINISLGESMDEYNPYYEAWTEALAYAASNQVVVVAAVGNLYTGGVSGPANMASVVGVGSVDREGAVSPGVTAKGPEVAVAAPGSTSLCTAHVSATPCEGFPAAGEEAGYVSFTGSSGAAPIVAGTAALIIAARPGISAADVVQRLVSTADNPAGPGQRDDDLGFGRIDPVAAVTSEVASVDENPLGVPAGTTTREPDDVATTTTTTTTPGATSGTAPDASGSTSADGGGVSPLAWVLVGATALAVATAAAVLIARRRRSAGTGF